MIGKTISRYPIVEKLGIAVSASALVVAFIWTWPLINWWLEQVRSAAESITFLTG